MAFSKDKSRVLLALSEGAKLHEFMRERDAPSKAMLEEWRDNDPEFEQAYQQAVEAGRVKRGEPAPKPKAPAIVTDQDGGEHPIPRSTALMREAAPVSAREADEPDPRMFREESPAAVPTAAPPAELLPPGPGEVLAENADTIFRNKMLARRQAGEKSTDLLKVPGMNGNKLARWRQQDPAFATAWDACRTPSDTTVARAAKAKQPASSFGLASEMASEVEKLIATNEQLNQQVADLEQYRTEQAHLTHELDVALFGEAAAPAPQATLADLIDPARLLRNSLDSHIANVERRNERDDWVRELNGFLAADNISVSDYLLAIALPDLASARAQLPERLEAHRAQKLARQQAQEAAAAVMQVKPDAPMHPGLLLAELLRQAGTPRAQFAAALGIGVSTLNTLLAGNTSLGVPLCAKLEKICWGTLETWCRRQADYDHYRATAPQDQAA